jgi:hypothetical protein
MKIIVSGLIALSVLAGLVAPASANPNGRGFWDQLESQQN